MKFNEFQKNYFAARNGAYSVVTDREVEDSQITATGDEAILLKSHFVSRKEPILVGNVSSNRMAAKKIFRFYQTGADVGLNLVFPKPAKPELRLYLSSKAGYKPPPGSVWFVYEALNGAITLGYMSMQEWEAAGLGHIEVRMQSKKSSMHTGLYEENGVVYLDVDVSKKHSCWCKL